MAVPEPQGCPVPQLGAPGRGDGAGQAAQHPVLQPQLNPGLPAAKPLLLGARPAPGQGQENCLVQVGQHLLAWCRCCQGIPDWFGWEHLKAPSVPPLPWAGHLPLAQDAPSFVQPGLGHCQGWASLSLQHTRVPMSMHVPAACMAPLQPPASQRDHGHADPTLSTPLPPSSWCSRMWKGIYCAFWGWLLFSVCLYFFFLLFVLVSNVSVAPVSPPIPVLSSALFP